jgi:hypothetical protein
MDPSEIVASVGGGAVAMKLVDIIVKRFVTKADQNEEAAEKKRDEREREMDGKLDQLLTQVATLSTETRNDRERSAAMAAAIQAAVSEVKARIDGVSANHGPRLGAVEQELAGLRARLDVMAVKGRR